MPELETRIREWRRLLSVACGGAEEIVEELESHLREEIERLTQAGQPPDAALANAQAKLGRPAELAAEYARAVPPVRWLPIFLCLTLPVTLLGFLGWAFFIPRLLVPGDALLVCHVTAIVAGYAAAFYAGLVGACYVARWLVRPIRLGQRRSLARALFIANVGAAVLLLLGMVLGAVWAHERHGQAWSNDPREIGTLIPLLWFVAVTGLWWAAPRQQHLVVLLSVLGFGVGVWGWFGHVLFEQAGHAQSHQVAFGLFLFTCTALVVAVFMLGLLPPGRLRRGTA